MARFSKILVANRSEIAVRIIRAARDYGYATAVAYADQDRDALFVRMADEAFALDGSTPAETYLDISKLLAVAERCGADAVHPGYGFLAENADFARAVQGAGLTWIGPPPQAIDALGDKVRARQIAHRVGAPLAAGTDGPVADVGQVLAFVESAGLPIAIKAAFGGGGRGLKIVHNIDDVASQFDAATREATQAFGRGECFVERFLHRPRHLETQCLADEHGNVMVVSTRDCSLQRRHQKLVEEAPAPFLTPGQHDTLVAASKAIMREAGYVGAGTCEFLLGEDQTISFLEVNTRLQVEHPVSEEITGLDLVAAQFRIANGESLGDEDPAQRGHSIEFRINAEDVPAGFIPSPGPIKSWRLPSGPGVRLDLGYEPGMAVPGEFDSLIGKLIVTGADRDQALRRARRALREFDIVGLPTVLPFHRAVVEDAAFVAGDGHFGVHTGWIADSFDAAALAPSNPAETAAEPAELESLVVEVDGRRLEVRMPVRTSSARRSPDRLPAATRITSTTHDGDDLTAPMPCSIVAVLTEEGAEIAEGDPVVAVEAMKMEQTISAHRDGVVQELKVEAGQSLTRGSLICRISSSGNPG